MNEQDFFERTQQRLGAGMRRGAHLPWRSRVRLRFASLTRRSRGLAVLVVGLVVVAPALAASGVFSTGSTVPAAKRQLASAGNGVALRTGVALTSLRVADPDGGPAWGLRVTRTTRGELCPVVGRVEHGEIGALGIDGDFHNDGLFHPYAANYPNYTFDAMACATADAQGYGFTFDDWLSAPTSASLRGQTTHGKFCLGVWDQPALVGRRMRRLRARGLRTPTHAICPASEVRDIYFGLLGPDATKIAYRSGDGKIDTETTAADGAYLVVLAHSPHSEPSTGGGSELENPPIVGVAMRSGPGCGVLGAQHPRRPLSDCAHEGFVAPTVTVPGASAARSPLTVRPLKSRYGSGMVSVSFIARLAVTDSRSYYAIDVTDPSHKDPGSPANLSCGGGTGGGSVRDIRAGQRITLTSGISGHCYGTAHGLVAYVIDRGTQTGGPQVIPLLVGPPRFEKLLARRYIVRIVGRFSYAVARGRVTP